MGARGSSVVAALALLGAACVMPPTPPPEQPTTAQATVEVGPGSVEPPVRTRLGEVKRCYEVQLKAHPGLAGTLVVHWTIQPNGTVGKADVEKDTTGSPALAGCLIHLIQSWRFPAPAGRDPVDVSFPFHFRSTP
jgi:outer membrane biosynthesis protein TonB